MCLNRSTLAVPLIVLALLACELGAQSFAIEALREGLASAEQKLEAPIAAFREKYVAQLKGLKESAQKRGDLELIVAVDKEIEASASDGSEIPPRFADLARLRRIYDQHLSILERKRSQERRLLYMRQRQKLGEIQTRLTKAGEIEEALAVRAEIASLTTVIDAGGSGRLTTASIAAAGGNRTPGKLVIFGTFSDGNLATLSDAQKRGSYIRVAAGYDHWMALGTDGKPTARVGGHGNFALPSGVRDIVDIQCGRHMHSLTKRDGTFIPLGGKDHTDHVPADLAKGSIAKVSLGHSKNAILLKDGSLIPFGYSFFYENIKFPRVDLTKEVVDMSVGAHGIAVKKKDGTVALVSIKGEDAGGRPESLEGEEVVAVESGLNHGALFLTKKGEVVSWNAPRPPEDLEKAVQIRAGAGFGAAQMEDGSWVLWGDHKGIAAQLNDKLGELGALKDLAIGSRFFVAVQ